MPHDRASKFQRSAMADLIVNLGMSSSPILLLLLFPLSKLLSVSEEEENEKNKQTF